MEQWLKLRHSGNNLILPALCVWGKLSAKIMRYGGRTDRERDEAEEGKEHFPPPRRGKSLGDKAHVRGRARYKSTSFALYLVLCEMEEQHPTDSDFMQSAEAVGELFLHVRANPNTSA